MAKDKFLIGMTISDITKIEDENDRFIVLHEEGIFFRAYDHSAYAFYSQICNMKTFKRSFKNLNGREVVYLGFPTSSSDIYLNNLEIVEKYPKYVKYRAPQQWDENEYTAWHNSVSCVDMKNDSMLTTIENQLLQQVRSFDISMSTPIDAFNFVLNLKRLVNI